MITVDVPRGLLLNANQRLHWRQKAERSKALREAAAWNAKTAPVWPFGIQPFAVKARCTVRVFWPDRRRRDVHNIMPTIKACIDGFVDSGMLTDDSDKYLVGPDLRVGLAMCDPDLACSLTFTFEAA